MKIAFWGTPAFAVPVFNSLLSSGHETALCVTQPDRPAGRKMQETMPPVKKIALERGIPVLQPEKSTAPEFIAEYKKQDYDLNVIVAFGQLLPDEVIYHPKHASINIHASLLPRYRGASPINAAILNGDTETGVTYQFIEKRMDAGDILYAEKMPILPEDDAVSMFEKLSVLAASSLPKVLSMVESGSFKREKQDESKATYVKMLKKEDGKIDFNLPAEKIFNMCRGLAPWPSAYASLEEKTLKVLKCEVVDKAAKEPGMVTEVIKGKGFVVSTGSGSLLVTEVQPESGKRMDAWSFCVGHKGLEGKILV